jgi:hypothetical protein
MASAPPKTSTGTQKMKMGPNALGTTKNVCQGAQYMKMEPYALGTTENEYVPAKHENGTRRPQYRQK